MGKSKRHQFLQVLGWVAVGLLLAVPVILFLVGIGATAIGHRYANRYEITELGYDPYDRFPTYDPRVENAKMAFPFLVWPCIGLALFLAYKLEDKSKGK